MSSTGLAMLVLLLVPVTSIAQATDRRYAAVVQVAAARSGAFDEMDFGVGAVLSARARDWLAVDGALTFYPSHYPDAPAFSRSRVEGLFGATLGPTLGRVRPFGRLRPGFLTLRDAPRPFACITIFPPPLACALAGGDTLLALDVGGGVEVSATGRLLIRLDIGDRMVRFDGPVIENRRVRQDAFFGHDLRVSAGAGWRF
jgi:hypothetical protein